MRPGGVFPFLSLFPSLCCLEAPAHAAKDPDLVDQIPGFPKTDFEVYSGMLDVPGPFLRNDYHSLQIHYQLEVSQRRDGDPTADPLVVWHQGGPGGSSIVGLFLEVGHFQLNQEGQPYVNQFSWNHVSNMLYLESPAGSGGEYGYSRCNRQSETDPDPVAVACEWDDVSQAEAYAHTLLAFLHRFPQFADNDMYLAGESYFGVYAPNIATFILGTEPFRSKLHLKGLVVGNGCWYAGAPCQGPGWEWNDVELFRGKALISEELYARIHFYCGGSGYLSCSWSQYFEEIDAQIGPYDHYNIYDNCPNVANFLAKVGKSMAWLLAKLRAGIVSPLAMERELRNMSGGLPYACKDIEVISRFLVLPPVRKALHLEHFQPGASSFKYNMSGPNSIDLYPALAKDLHILLYSGDTDLIVPYTSTQRLLTLLEERGALRLQHQLRPWFIPERPVTAAGSVTSYSAPGSALNFSFVLLRLAGHMAPMNRPQAALAMLKQFGIQQRTNVKISFAGHPSGPHRVQEGLLGLGPARRNVSAEVAAGPMRQSPKIVVPAPRVTTRRTLAGLVKKKHEYKLALGGDGKKNGNTGDASAFLQSWQSSDDL